jgi:predicted TPR repeat methyltransferase
LTDGDSNVLKVLQQNIQTNAHADHASAIQCQQLVWGKNLNELDKKFNVIIAADCLYMKTSVKPLFETVNHLLSNDGVLIYIMVCASQSSVEYILEVASSNHLEWELDGDSVYLFRRVKCLSKS